ncbi:MULTISPECIES: FCD domain-containing protein [unclassified Mesorhizobium]|uniref:FCD domain-containing protein n=1 Tax=unclassified Mesorhizobium TaxID=325217 RepID=UPI001674A410|nr:MULTISPECIES: FCD domain-containing protein [unclassified Mesorhizobium]
MNQLRGLETLLRRRLLYEPRALRLAIPRLRDADVADAESILVRCDLSMLAKSRVKLALDYHGRLMQRCGDTALLARVLTVHATVLENISERASVILTGERTQHQLWCLLEHCRRRQTDQALDILREAIDCACLGISEIAGRA